MFHFYFIQLNLFIRFSHKVRLLIFQLSILQFFHSTNNYSFFLFFTPIIDNKKDKKKCYFIFRLIRAAIAKAQPRSRLDRRFHRKDLRGENSISKK